MENNTVSRDCTGKLDIRRLKGLKHEEVVESLQSQNFPIENVQAVQITNSACLITFKTEELTSRLISEGLVLRENHNCVSKVNEDITNVAIKVKDLPIELPDCFVFSCLMKYGKPKDPVVHGFIKGTEIKTGTRYCKLTEVKTPIPVHTKFGNHDVRIFCDNGKTECLYCGLTNHPFYRCKDNPKKKVCYLCGSDRHLKRDCDLNINEMEHNQQKPSEKENKKVSEKTQKGITHSKPIHETESRQPGPKGNPLRAKTASEMKKVVLGASNCRDLHFDDENVEVYAQSGLCASEVGTLLSKVTEPEKVDVAVLHLGTNDIKSAKADSNDVILSLQEAISNVRDTMPNLLQIGVCSIPPRRGSSNGCKAFNEKVNVVNDFLKKLSSKSLDVFFVDNDQILLTENKKIRKSMYNLDDNTGIHYSKEGKTEIAKNIEHALYPPSGFIQILKPESKDSKKRNRSELSTPSTVQDSKIVRTENDDISNVLEASCFQNSSFY